MNLSDYLDYLGDEKAASLFGVSVFTVRSWRQRVRLPRVVKAREMVAASGGMLTLAGIYDAPVARGRITEDAPRCRINGDTATIVLSMDYEAVIDASDAPLVVNHTWSARESHRANGELLTVYAVARIAGRITYLHRLLLNPPLGVEVDHKDGDGLNNRRSNLRHATIAQNKRNARLRHDNKSGAKGVYAVDGRFVAQIRADDTQHYLGTFDTREEAAAAYAKASATLHGEFGRLR